MMRLATPLRLLIAASLAALLGACASTGRPVSPPASEMPPVPAAPVSGIAPAKPPAIAPRPALPLPPAPPRASAPVYSIPLDGPAAVARLLPRAPDAKGWSAEIFSAFAALRLPATTENVCAAIAIIGQESNFQADPVVPGLSRIVWREIEKRRVKYDIPKLLLDAALLKSSPDGRSYKMRINALKTETQMNALFEDMIAELPYGKTLLKDYNPIRTGGPMQVSVEFAHARVREKPYPYPLKNGSLRDEVFTRRGGVYFGIADLLDYPAPYTRPIYRFADYNAGRYSSRNAAFQAALSKLAGRALSLDGDLLRYSDGLPSSETSLTQRVIYPMAGRLHLSRAEIMRDLRLEKSAAFAQTPLYQRLFALAEHTTGKPLPHEAMPRIDLKSPKIHRHLTTEWFARRVDMRYQTCLKRQ
ncbi:MAG: DUF1615 domain-containing protein [Burkholderiales bacterium]